MEIKTSIRFYNNKPVRACFDYDSNTWLYAAVDLINAIIITTNPRRYWSDLKRRNNELFANCVQLKLTSRDGKKYRTDLLDENQLHSLLVKTAKSNNKDLSNWLKGLNNPLDEKSRLKAYELYDNGLLKDIEVGTIKGLQQIHAYIFGGLYDFAGKIRTKTIMKDNFVFCDARYLKQTLMNIDAMSQSNLTEIVDKYIEMNVAHPFMEGNGRSTRIWLDQMLKDNLNQCVDWSMIDKKDYLSAMKKSPLDSKPIYKLIESSLTDKIYDRELFMKGIDYSYYYEETDE